MALFYKLLYSLQVKTNRSILFAPQGNAFNVLKMLNVCNDIMSAINIYSQHNGT